MHPKQTETQMCLKNLMIFFCYFYCFYYYSSLFIYFSFRFNSVNIFAILRIFRKIIYIFFCLAFLFVKISKNQLKLAALFLMTTNFVACKVSCYILMNNIWTRNEASNSSFSRIMFVHIELCFVCLLLPFDWLNNTNLHTHTHMKTEASHERERARCGAINVFN